MRAYDISLYSFCVACAIAMLAPTRIFIMRPTGIDLASVYVYSTIAAALMASGISMLGYSLKLSASITTFGSIYAGSCAWIMVLMRQFLSGTGAEGIFIGIFTPLLFFLGVWAILQIAKGPMGVEE